MRRQQQQKGRHGGEEEVENEEEWWKSDDSEGTSDEEADMKPGTAEEHDSWLFDPRADTRDEAWMQKRRGGRQSDAILSCPGCLTTLCLDCQQHTQYLNQFRAMFVTNCRVEHGQPKARQSTPTIGRKRGSEAEGTSAPPADRQQPVANARIVKCDVCNLEVGIQDTDDVFHFYNVMPSTA